MNKIVCLLAMVFSIHAMADVPVHQDRNEAEYNNQFAVVLNGYDPVSYFPEGGGSPVQGLTSITFTYGTRMYYFASEENKAEFKKNPLKYEPSYGSWCAYAMSQGSKVDIQPTIYTISGNRLHFFISKSAKKTFDKDVAGHEKDADQNWFGFSAEQPRN
jgi:YHS domain-containing protein